MQASCGFGLNSSLRSFYLSPSKTSKITKDAYHFVISTEIYQSGGKNGLSIFKCKGRKILCLEKLEVDVKYESQANNIHLKTFDSCPFLS